MRAAIICFSDELESAVTLVKQAAAFSPKPQLWVLGGLRDYPPEKTGAAGIFEVEVPQEVLSQPYCCAQALNDLFCDHPPQLIMTVSGLWGDELAAQLSLLINSRCVLCATAISPSDGGVIIQKPVYAGNLQAEFFCGESELCISLSPKGGDKKTLSAPPEITHLSWDGNIPHWLCGLENRQTERESSLNSASLVLAAGRGVGKSDNFKKLDALANKLGGVLGGSRPTVCEGKLPSEMLIGMSGSRIKPDICMVFGASGAAAFRAGIEESRLLVAINRDPSAMIFESCDYGVVADCNDFAAALSELLG